MPTTNAAGPAHSAVPRRLTAARASAVGARATAGFGWPIDVRNLQSALCLVVGLVAALAGCDQQAMFEKLVPKDEAAIARQLLSQVAAKDFANVEKQLDPRVQGPSVRGGLEQMAALFPAEEPKAVTLVGSHTSTVNDLTTYNLTFEYEYADAWVLASVALQRRDGRLTVLGLHAEPEKQSLKEANRFTFAGKGPLHYIVFALVIAIPLFIVYALVVCIRAPNVKRKWLWLVFVALGFVEFSLNWTTGGYAIGPARFLLLGAGFYRAAPYAPFVFDVAIPLGAILFVAKRRSLAARHAA